MHAWPLRRQRQMRTARAIRASRTHTSTAAATSVPLAHSRTWSHTVPTNGSIPTDHRRHRCHHRLPRLRHRRRHRRRRRLRPRRTHHARHHARRAHAARRCEARQRRRRRRRIRCNSKWSPSRSTSLPTSPSMRHGGARRRSISASARSLMLYIPNSQTRRSVTSRSHQSRAPAASRPTHKCLCTPASPRRLPNVSLTELRPRNSRQISKSRLGSVTLMCLPSR
mmetsp:Transcript_29959/g.65531  ORF Transcript_29959/g.65531 Transcript_29959/m.65531 type:complete len:224 (-) Transcript_29959:77-748(-)